MKITISLFVTFSCTVFIACYASEEQESKIIIKGLESCSNIISIYKTEFTSANFPRLLNTLDEFNHSMVNYSGAAGNHLTRLNALNNATKYAYSDCVKPIDHSCELITEMNDLMIGPADEFEGEYEFQWNTTVVMSFYAVTQVNASLPSLKYLKHCATELKKILDAALIDINKDFGPEGFFVKNNQLSGRVILKKRSLCKKINTARAILDRFDNMDVEFYEDMDNLNAFVKLLRKCYRENRRMLLTGNTSLRKEIVSKYNDLATQQCNEYRTWYQSNHET